MKFGDYIKRLRESKGLGLNELAEKAGLSNATISYIESGRNEPSTRTIQKLAKALDSDSAVLLAILDTAREYEEIENELGYVPDSFKINTDIKMDYKVPLIGSVRAGVPILATENIESYLLYDSRRLNKDATYFALKIVGDSMDKLFREGDVVLVEKMDMVSNGQIAVVGINGDEATVKRVTFADGNIALIPESNNPAHVTKVYNIKDDEIHIIGRVVQSTRFF